MILMSKSVCLLALLLALMPPDLSAKRPPKPGKRVKEDVSVTAVNVEDDGDSFDDSSITVDIEYSIGTNGDDDFTRRGTVYLKGLRTSRTSVSFQQDTLSQTQLQNLKSAAKSGDMYFLRAKSAFTEGSLSEEHPETGFVMTVISACSLYNAQLSDWITISGDGQGNIIGLTVTTPVHTMGMDCTNDVHLPHHFNTSISLDNGTPGPFPNTQGFHEKVEKEEQKKRDGTENKSFLQKYWLYILIGFIAFTMVSGGLGGGGQ